MAFQITFPLFSPFKSPINNGLLRPRTPVFHCSAVMQDSKEAIIVRRSANYKTPLWDYDSIQSLKSNFLEESYVERSKKLKGEVKKLFNKKSNDPLYQLELVDTLQRLGISYHFEDEIDNILNNVIWNIKSDDLYVTSLQFRLLRQHGYDISADIFNGFKDERRVSFKGFLAKDTKGLLSLYEASLLLKEEETILEEAKIFSTKLLEEYVKFINKNKDEYLYFQVSHALKVPFHWRMRRSEAQWFIDVYEKQENMDQILFDLAKLDYNMVQAVHQEELKQLSRWWKSMRCDQELSFARNRLMESFIWTMGIAHEPQFTYFRSACTQVVSLINTIDDIYDVYGTLDELKLFTKVVERWDMKGLDCLPQDMKFCFLILDKETNEMGLKAFKEQGVDILPHLKKMWKDLCEAYLLEAEWFYTGYKPSLKEYMENAWISVAVPLVLLHTYCFTTKTISMETLDVLSEYPQIVCLSGMAFRYLNDLATSSEELKRGDTVKSIQCYMQETGASEEDARKHIQYLVSEAWKKINQEQLKSSSNISKIFSKIVLDLVRSAHFIYRHDNHKEMEEDVKFLIDQPVAYK